MNRFLSGSERTQSAFKHLLGYFTFSFTTVGLAYVTYRNYPMSITDLDLGESQGYSEAEMQKVKNEYGKFAKEWKEKGKQAQEKVRADLKQFKQMHGNMSVEQMQEFDKEANSALNKLDKI